LRPIGSEAKEQQMTSRDQLAPEEVLAAFDEHLRRTRGVCAGTRRNYARFVRGFLRSQFADGPVEVTNLYARDVVGFVGGLTRCYRPRTVELAASALRSFFRFLRAAGLRGDRLEDAVPMVPHRRSGLVRHLEPGRLEQRGCPHTAARQVFVLHRLRVGAPISDSIVGRAVDNALRRAQIQAPIRGANLLRHSLATDLVGHGASLIEIAELFGHSSLATTRIYAVVDVAALRQVALPWPQATS
jgi:site-specific recombinase XerD